MERNESSIRSASPAGPYEPDIPTRTAASGMTGPKLGRDKIVKRLQNKPQGLRAARLRPISVAQVNAGRAVSCQSLQPGALNGRSTEK